MRNMHLFAGAGGGLLADLILGHTPVVAVEWDRYACAVLRERASDGWFPGLHVHEGDIRQFDPSGYAGRVDCVHAGFPCQDISVAGKGRGIEGERSGLWQEVVRVVDAVRPAYIFLENSPAIVSRGLVVVLSGLADLGFDARWCVLPAAAVGAPHLRARWFCLASNPDLHDGQAGVQKRGRRRERRAPAAGEGGTDMADAGCQRLEEWSDERGHKAEELKAFARAGDVENSKRQCRGAEEHGNEADGQEPHGPAGWSSGSGWWLSEPDVGRVALGVAARVDRLRCIGNGQVPLQAATAWKLLGGPVT